MSTEHNKNNALHTLFSKGIGLIRKKKGMNSKGQMFSSITKEKHIDKMKTPQPPSTSKTKELCKSISHKDQPGKARKHKVRSHLLPGI